MHGQKSLDDCAVGAGHPRNGGKAVWAAGHAGGAPGRADTRLAGLLTARDILQKPEKLHLTGDAHDV